jgi:hypothetical protein
MKSLFLIGITCGLFASAKAGDLGLFEQEADIGKPTKAGSTTFAPQDGVYELTGGGANMWFTNDAFHFVWKRVSGDFALDAAVQWVAEGGNAHRKACLVVRQSLGPDSAYVDVAVHGNGMTSLQYREASGGLTHEIQVRPAKAGQQSRPSQGGEIPAQPATRMGIERQGESFVALLPKAGETSAEANAPLSPAGAFMRLKFDDPVYVGLGVCSHDDAVVEKARFSQVELHPKAAPGATAKPVLHCALEIVPIGSSDRRVVYHTLDHIEAPNWSRDGQVLLFNSGGHIYRLPVAGGSPVLVDTGTANRCNNDHGFSPDGQWLAVSDQARTGKSLIYILPAEGGAPHQVTTTGPSYWHGWSPDGSTLAYCAERAGEFDIYTIPAMGGDEQRLTTAKGLDDGPDFSPDGKWIYFNSERTGRMQIWRMKPDGSQQQQVTNDEFNNWFPHPSPDGKWLVFITFEKDVTGHPPNKPVRLRLLPIVGGPIQELARLFGGQGTINVPSWSPDSRQLAFVSYELLDR